MLFLLLLAGCSGADEGESCDLSHREGTYLQHASERSGGTCGELSDQVVRIDDTSALPPGCALDAPDKPSGDQCSVTRSYSCAFPDGTGVATAITTEHDGGATMSGTITITIRHADGGIGCISTYNLALTRQ